jgi:hypothetical protein
MWGLKMISFLTSKVLAEGQTSGSGGWVNNLALITMKAMIDDGRWQSKKRMSKIQLALTWRQV